MDDKRATELLRAERLRVQTLLRQATDDAADERQGANEPADMSDPATSLTAEGEEDAVATSLRLRLAAIERAERRLVDGTYGRSVQSGEPIPDERLEADPAADLTVDEAAAQ